MFMRIVFNSLMLVLPLLAHSQKVEIEDVKYRRSSLHTILIDSDEFFPNKEVIIEAYKQAPFPDKYNNHEIDSKILNPGLYHVTDAERDAAGQRTGFMAGFVKGYVDELSNGWFSMSGADLPIIIEKYIRDERIANQLVAKWFNRKDDGTFDMDLIAERGYYNASELEAEIAKGDVRGIASLADAGEELISNTFVVFSRVKFLENEKLARIVRDEAYSKALLIPNELARSLAIMAADKVYAKTSKGYSIVTESFLYKLVWNDSISTVFYTQLWMDSENLNPSRKYAFDQSDLFQLEFIGSQKSRNILLVVRDEAKVENEILKEATIQSIDNVYAKLQKEYDVFKTKTPIYSIDPITAKIGLKEGIEGKDKFEVLNQQINGKTGKTEYIRVATIAVDPNMIWDNRYYVGQVDILENDQMRATVFKGGGKGVFPGMLIRQIK